MFCRNCGKEIAEGKKFCGGCGTPVAAPAPAQETVNAAPAPEAEAAPAVEDMGATQVITEQPVMSEQQYYQPAAPVYPEPKVGKGKFVKTKASASVKSTAFVARIVGLVCLVLCVAVCWDALLAPITDWPVFDYAGIDTGELDKPMEELDRIIDEGIYREELDDYDGYVERVRDTIGNPSIVNFYIMGEYTEEIADEINDDFDSLDDFLDMLKIMIFVVGGYTLFLMLLTLLALLFRNNVLTVLALLLGIGSAILLAGVVHTVILAAAYILLFALQFAVNKSYKAYRRA